MKTKKELNNKTILATGCPGFIGANVVAVDIVPEMVEKITKWISPIQDDYIEKFLAEHEKRQFNIL